MDTSDELGTILVLASTAMSAASAAGAFSSGPDKPKIAPPESKTTAASQDQTSEMARRNRRMRASLLTQGFEAPQLGTPGLLGQ